MMGQPLNSSVRKNNDPFVSLLQSHRELLLSREPVPQSWELDRRKLRAGLLRMRNCIHRKTKRG